MMTHRLPWDKILLWGSAVLVGWSLSLLLHVPGGLSTRERRIAFIQGVISQQVWENCRTHTVLSARVHKRAWDNLFLSLKDEEFLRVTGDSAAECQQLIARLPQAAPQ